MVSSPLVLHYSDMVAPISECPSSVALWNESEVPMMMTPFQKRINMEVGGSGQKLSNFIYWDDNILVSTLSTSRVHQIPKMTVFDAL